MPRITAPVLRAKKQAGEPIVTLTAYDYPSAKLADEAGVDVILVGDSCATTVMGLPSTLGITMDAMVHHTAMASRAAKHALVIADMPFMSYQVSEEEALRNAGRLVVEGGAQAVKLEGPMSKYGGAIERIIRAGIPVMGHLGLLPQHLLALGGYALQGADEQSAQRIVYEAEQLAGAGCCAIVLEKVPAVLAERVSKDIPVPTIGIGAGPGCDGQVLVMHDMLGLGISAKHVKVYADLGAMMRSAFADYVRDVKEGAFPGPEHSH